MIQNIQTTTMLSKFILLLTLLFYYFYSSYPLLNPDFPGPVGKENVEVSYKKKKKNAIKVGIHLYFITTSKIICY